ncbi:MAG TPA: pitrilysin family protein, partial [Thermoanaerobaculia bacterium]|nr:pitrilysin family protein [Thermoanaerobaculia bacterium]
MKMKKPAIALALLLGAGVALAQKQSPPAPAAPRSFEVPAATKFKLDNGLQVTLVPYGTVPKVRIELAVLAGNAYDDAKQVSLADLTGDLMREGTTTKSSSEISQAAARMGGSLDVAVSVNTAEISGDVLSEFGPEMARLVADVALNPKFPESELPRLKADALRALSITKSQPQQMAVEKFRGVMYPGHPYGRVFPTPETIQAFTVANVRSFYDANYGAGRAHLYVAGRFDRPAMEAAIRQAFAGWKKGKPSMLQPPQPKSTRAVYLVDRPGAVQSTILLGMQVPDPSNPDYVPLSVVNTLLGGYFSSRITANLREAKGYTYSPSSQLSTRYR